MDQMAVLREKNFDEVDDETDVSGDEREKSEIAKRFIAEKHLDEVLQGKGTIDRRLVNIFES